MSALREFGRLWFHIALGALLVVTVGILLARVSEALFGAWAFPLFVLVVGSAISAALVVYVRRA